MSGYVDGIMRQWGERYDWNVGFSKPKMKHSSISLIPTQSSGNAGTARATLKAMVQKVPEVMVKVTGGARTQRGARAAINYIAREGEKDKESVELVDQDGNRYIGAGEVKEAADMLIGEGYAMPEKSKHRQTFSVVLSMPPGTDREAVARAAEDFAKKHYSNHQYLIAHHRDESHPHAHIIVKSRSSVDGKNMDIRKVTLQKWRASFAKELEAHGVEAVATKAKSRFNTPLGRNWKKTKFPNTDKNKRSATPQEQINKEARNHNLLASVLANSPKAQDRQLSKDIKTWVQESTKKASNDKNQFNHHNFRPEIAATLRTDLYNVRGRDVAKEYVRN